MKLSFNHILLLFLFLLTSCASTGQKPVSEPALASQGASELFKQAKADLSRKDLRAASAKFQNVIAAAPGSELALQSHIELGDMLYQQERWQEANTQYQKAIQLNLRSPLTGVAGIKSAQALIAQEKVQDALAALDQGLRTDGLSNSAAVQGLRLRLQILKRTSSPVEEIKTLIHLYSRLENTSQKEEARVQALGLAESRLSTQQLEEIATDTKYDLVRPVVLFRLGTARFERGEFSSARRAFNDVILLAPQTEVAERSAELLQQLEARERVNPRRIGVVLPLTGKQQRVAQKTLRGLQLGLGIFGNNRSGYELAVIDSSGNPAVARRAVESLVAEDNVIGIVGGLTSKEAQAVASKAQEFGVPTFSLSQKAGLTEIGNYVFRNALTSEMQVKQLVHEAIHKRGLKRFALLYSNDAYGQEFAQLFWDEVIKNGGEIRGAQTYSPGDTDFNKPIRMLVGTAQTDARKQEYKLRLDDWKKNRPATQRRDEPEDILPPLVDFEAIFIPDTAKALGQIAPTLAYNEIKNITLIGPNLWNTNATVERAGKFLQDPIFLDSVLIADPEFQNSTFFKEYFSLYGENPDDFDVVAFDTGLILRRALDSGASSRADLQGSLLNLGRIQGAFGEMMVTPQREIARPVTMLTIKEGKIQRTQDSIKP